MASITLATSETTVQAAHHIAPVSHAEASRLATAELDRVLALVDQLAGDDWQQPTDCTAWNVRDMVAHLAGACAAFASWRDFRQQMIQNPYMREEKIPVDAINRVQTEQRADHTPEQLIAELRAVGPKAIRTRQRIPWPLRQLPVIPFGSPWGMKPVKYLTDTIYTRDWWMHRVDICNATGQTMVVTPEHDGRIVDLVMRDIAAQVSTSETIDLVLVGPLTGHYRFGGAPEPQATITLDNFEFHRLASERITVEAAWSLATIEGDESAARRFLEQSAVPY